METATRRRDRPALAAAIAALVVALALAAVMASPLRRHLDAPVFDLFSTIAPPAPASDIVVVAIDEPSFAEIGKQWPWPRSLHADLVKALRAAGARVIALDMVFAEPSSVEGADAALAAAMGPDVVLAADETVVETPQAAQTIRIEPLPELLTSGATSGVAAVALDLDGALRRRPPVEGGFAEAVAAKAGGGVPHAPERGLVRFRGGPRTYPTVSYYQALDPATFLPPATFKDKIVFVGLSTQTLANASSGAADAFATPFTSRTGRLTAGVEVQATIFDALRSGDLVRPAPLWAEIAALFLAAGVGAGLARGGRVTLRATLSAVALAAGIVLLSFFALRHGFWLSPAAPALALLLVVATDAALDYARERRARREIAHAFGQYLSPDLVDRLARDPSSLKLGGEARTLTILFCDVRGFTTLAERMKDDPERLTRLINRLLQPLSQAVLDHGGTIDKYIGDCVMAFWNAPLDAPNHAEKAVAAGLAMLEGVEKLNAELAAETTEGETPLSFTVGVGVNTGECVVGNLGSEKRFDYTAIGDAVNLASRLESASRFYGVPMLVGEATAELAGGRFLFVELDRIAVKGRSGGLAVYTVAPGGSEAAVTHAAMLARYRARDWAGAWSALNEIRAASPWSRAYADGMAERIAGLEANPPPADWDGVFSPKDK